MQIGQTLRALLPQPRARIAIQVFEEKVQVAIKVVKE